MLGSGEASKKYATLYHFSYTRRLLCAWTVLGGAGLEKDLEGDRENVHDTEPSVTWLPVSRSLTLCLEKQRRFSGQIRSGESTDPGPFCGHTGGACRARGHEPSSSPCFCAHSSHTLCGKLLPWGICLTKRETSGWLWNCCKGIGKETKIFILNFKRVYETSNCQG